jgi:hypothetical protein
MLRLYLGLCIYPQKLSADPQDYPFLLIDWILRKICSTIFCKILYPPFILLFSENILRFNCSRTKMNNLSLILDVYVYLLSGYCRFISLLTLFWNFFMSNNLNGLSCSSSPLDSFRMSLDRADSSIVCRAHTYDTNGQLSLDKADSSIVCQRHTYDTNGQLSLDKADSSIVCRAHTFHTNGQLLLNKTDSSIVCLAHTYDTNGQLS